jgi:hypothetical protein
MVNHIILATDNLFIRPADESELVQVWAVGRMNSDILEKPQEPLSKTVEKFIHVPLSPGWNKD